MLSRGVVSFVRSGGVVAACIALLATDSGAAPRWRRGPLGGPELTARTWHAMAYDTNRSRVVLVGGHPVNSRPDVWEYDGTKWRFVEGAPAALARAQHAMVYDSVRGRMVVFGGSYMARLDDTWEYDGTSWFAGPVAPAGLTPRTRHAMAFDAARGRSVVFGGQDASGYLNDTWE